MIAAAVQTGQLLVYVCDEEINEAAVASLKQSHPNAIVLADLLEPLYEASMQTREAAHMLGRIKAELEAMVHQGTRVVVVCRRRNDDLGTRAHFLSSLCASADRVHFLKST